MRQVAATGADVAALHAFVDGGWTAEAFASSRHMLIDALLAGPSRPAAS